MRICKRDKRLAWQHLGKGKTVGEFSMSFYVSITDQVYIKILPVLI